jgi:hypothetical protein
VSANKDTSKPLTLTNCKQMKNLPVIYFSISSQSTATTKLVLIETLATAGPTKIGTRTDLWQTIEIYHRKQSIKVQ